LTQTSNPKPVIKLSQQEIDDLSKQAVLSLESNNIESAFSALNKILSSHPNHQLSLWNRSIAWMRSGNMNAALVDLYSVLREQPQNLEARNQIRFIHRKLIANWHYDMINDSERNEAYLNAINSAVKDKTVFEIGTGSGLLSMMAARAGATHVYTCEKEMAIRNAAWQIIKRNNLSEKISIIDKWSTSTKVPNDIPNKVDVLVAEIFGPGLIEEQALHFFKDAKQRLLKPNGIIIPKRATMFCALFESEEITRRALVKNVCGFDLSLFNGLHDDPAIQLTLSKFPHRMLSEPVTIKSINFLDDNPIESSDELTITANDTGTCHGVVQWFRLYTDDNNFIDTSPFKQRTHWDQQLQVYEKPFNVTKGQQIQFVVRQFSDRFSVQPRK
jgi:predicted O-methyltransferase YrrM